jgi:subtilisin family serine protease
MKRLAGSLPFALAFGFTALAAPTAELIAQNATTQTADVSQEPTIEAVELWFVELSTPPTAAGGNRNTVRAQKASFRAAAQAAGISFTERYAFDTLFNGVSIAVDPARLAAVARLPQVSGIYPVLPFSLPEPMQPGEMPELATALAMTGADIARSELGLTGAGVKVGIIDSGIDYDHPDLGGCFGPGCRVAAGHDFVGDAYTGGNTPVPDADPDDCSAPFASPPAPLPVAGHGTHVSGIVGANGTLKGVAPGVTFGAYRVFGCNGATQADILIAALERALADGMHVVNMSIGAALQWPQYPTSVASTRLVGAGVTVVAAAGNDGAIGLYGSAAPAVGEKVISVASFNNTHSNLPHFTISPDDRVVTYSNANGAPHPPVSGTFPLARTGDTESVADACNTQLPLPDLSDKIALVRRGTCPFTEKVANAHAAGALAVVIYNNVAGGITPSLSPPATIPVVGIAAADGVLINSRLDSGPVDLMWQAGLIQTRLRPAG